MLALLLILAAISYGSAIQTFFFSTKKTILFYTVSLIWAYVLGSWLIFLSVLTLGYQKGIWFFIGSGLALLIVMIKKELTKKELIQLARHGSSYGQALIKKSYRSLSQGNRPFFIFIFLIWALVFIQLSVTHSFYKTVQGYFSGGGSYGDLAMHGSLVQYFGLQPKLDLTSPIYAQNQTTYPFLLDFLAGQLYRTGLSFQTSLILTNAPLMIAFLFLLWELSYRLTKRLRLWLITSSLFLLNGGMGIVFFFRDWLQARTTLLDFLLHQPLQYAHLADYNIHWSNIVADYFLPQRGMILGLSIFLMVLLWFFETWQKKQTSLQKITVISLLVGLSPLLHIHSFIVLAPLLTWMLLWLVITKRIRWPWLIVGVIIQIVIAAPQLYWQLLHTNTNHFLAVELGWMGHDHDIVNFWLKNMGPSIVLWPASLVVAFSSKKNRSLAVMLFPLIVLFVLTNIFQFQPHDYDNMKLMIFTFLGACITVGVWLDEAWEQAHIPQLIIIGFVIVASVTGFVSLLRETTLFWQMSDQQDIALAEEIKAKTDPTGIFLTSDEHNHPVPMLAGRKILMGYRGWLWTYGINYGATEYATKLMFKGGPAALELLKEYHIAYVFIGPNEREKWQANENFYAEHFQTVIHENRGAIYKIDGL